MNLIIEETNKLFYIELSISNNALFKYRVELTQSGMVTKPFHYAIVS
jgi:hypothetical protein